MKHKFLKICDIAIDNIDDDNRPKRLLIFINVAVGKNVCK